MSDDPRLYTAVIIEPRMHRALELVLCNFNKNLDERWTFLIYHGNNNNEFISNIIVNNKITEKRTVELVSLNVDNLTIDQYNLLLFSRFFYDNIKTETFLIFQTDTLISDVHASKIYNFLEYDYVGAPWVNKQNDFEAVGNGGFSLRKKTKMIELIKNGGYLQNGHPHYEDRFFSNTCGNANCVSLHKPTLEIAKQFSVETIFNKDSIGIHKPWAYLSRKQIELLQDNFFDIYKLMSFH